ncbi:MAG TPA: TIGR02679 family protein [Thermoanaerobaculia bacterium]|nr:TIGR02679 family protein [Thermoanaerobaculia bacterium]
MSPEGELLDYLGRRELARLWPEVRVRMESLGEARGTVRLASVRDDERRAVADLLGLAKLPSGDVRIRLDRLDQALRASRFGVDLRTAMILLGGPLRDRTGEREEERLRWRELWADALAHPAVAARPGLRPWLAGLQASGLLRRLAAAGEERRLLEQALAVLAALAPPREDVRLSVLASEALETSHALDAGRPVPSLVLRALALLADRPPPRSARERRELWEAAGVVTDDLSCDLLVLGLVPAGRGLVAEGLRAFAAAGEPVRLTLRQIAAGSLVFPPGLRVRVCENPVVVAAAADRWGPASAPLICLGGFPNHAGRRLLAHLARHGAEILYHGDFDWAGLMIANSLRETVPFEPWRFKVNDYRAALAHRFDRPELRDRPVPAPWDPELDRAMAEAGVAVEEETVLGDLIEDLGPAPSPRPPIP